MATEFERKHHEILADLIERILRTRTGLVRVPDLASDAGFSRFHLARLFHEVVGEQLDSFVRRIRLERSAFMLINSSERVEGVAIDCGYKNAEAFSRAFKSAYGLPPTRFRTSQNSWKLETPNGLHWVEHWGVDDPNALPGYVDLNRVYRPPIDVAVWEWWGNYGRLADGWAKFESHLASDVPKGKTFITIYHDNMWTHPTDTTMRAELGWYLERDEQIPKGMKRLTLPAGIYEVTARILERKERNDAWSYVSARKCDGLLALDEYPSWPLPFEQVRTRIVRGPWKI